MKLGFSTAVGPFFAAVLLSSPMFAIFAWFIMPKVLPVILLIVIIASMGVIADLRIEETLREPY